MADRPILFSAPMVRALIAGTKTQTRRILKPLPNRTIFFDPRKAGLNQHQSPRIAVGDRLYVREHWRTTNVLDDIAPRDLRKSETVTVDYTPVLFIADEATQSFDSLVDPPFGKHRQAMHMPKWASRITLIVESVKTERLQDISEDDADAECFGGNYPSDVLPEVFPGDREQYGHLTMTQCYGRLWDHINGAGAWEANPWVAAYSFRRVMGNIDQIGGAA